MKIYLVSIFLIISTVVFSQANMTDQTYDELRQYSEKLSDGKDVNIPDGVKIEKTDNRYSRGNYTCQFDYIVDNRTEKTTGIFITCIQERSQYDKYEYLILPFNNTDKLDAYIKQKKKLVYSMEEFLDKSTSYKFTKYVDKLVNDN